MKIGSHVSFSGKTPFVSAVTQAIDFGANSLMIYTGAPQNTRRKELNLDDIENAKLLLKKNNMNIEDVIIHAPYIINLANPVKEQTRTFGREFLIEEVKRCNIVGSTIMVLHPGSHLKEGFTSGLKHLSSELEIVLNKTENVNIALETMAGKGGEMGRTFEELNDIIKSLSKENQKRVGVCLDTCHIHDAGYDVSKVEKLFDDFDNKIGLSKLLCIHINDSKNILGARKDRHENIGYGEIGFDPIKEIVHYEKVKHLVKILETPYFGGFPPYKEEIKMLKEGAFCDWRK